MVKLLKTLPGLLNIRKKVHGRHKINLSCRLSVFSIIYLQNVFKSVWGYGDTKFTKTTEIRN